MNRKATVHLHWLVNTPAGHSPRGQRFARPARFEHQAEDWINNAWSLAIQTDGIPDQSRQQEATVRFLAPDAPHDWLIIGARFTLYENVPIAEGIVKHIFLD